MSFTIVEPAPARLNRSELAVPGSNPKLFKKAAESAADVVFLDLEDAVAPDDKEQARKNIIKALNEVDWGSKTLSVRINGLDTHYMYRDVIDIIEQGGERLDLIMIPKAGTAAAANDANKRKFPRRKNMRIPLHACFRTGYAAGISLYTRLCAAFTRTAILRHNSTGMSAPEEPIRQFELGAAKRKLFPKNQKSGLSAIGWS